MKLKRILTALIVALLLSASASDVFAQRKRHNRPGTHYKNSERKRARKPARANTAPAGASAECRDGTFSFSANHRGTCSHHGGVKRWLR